jgi:ribonucleoside-triphosphate reductase
MIVIKRNGDKEDFNADKIVNAVYKAFQSVHIEMPEYLYTMIPSLFGPVSPEGCIGIEEIQDKVEQLLMNDNHYAAAKSYILYRERHKNIRNWVEKKQKYINKYKESSNTANATIDDNSNVANKNIGILNAEIHKEDNIQISRKMVTDKLKELYPDFDSKQYINDLENHIIYKHDESSFAGAVAPYCCSITMYPFLTGGIKGIGGLSASPKNLDSFCGMYINLIFATSAMFAGAVATSEFLLYFDYFAKKEWGENYYLKEDTIITSDACNRKKTIKSQIHQYFQQVIYSINQPAAARGMQSAFVNFSYFDKPFFEGMFGDFYFPDNTQPTWESLNWLQKEFMQWFNAERLRTMITFPVNKSAA